MVQGHNIAKWCSCPNHYPPLPPLSPVVQWGVLCVGASEYMKELHLSPHLSISWSGHRFLILGIIQAGLGFHTSSKVFLHGFNNYQSDMFPQNIPSCGPEPFWRRYREWGAALLPQPCFWHFIQLDMCDVRHRHHFWPCGWSQSLFMVISERNWGRRGWTHPGSQSRLTQTRNVSQASPPRARFFPVPPITPPIPLAPRGG